MEDTAPHPQALIALERFSPLSNLLYETLEAATETARQFFEPEDRHWDGYFYSHYVRYAAYGILRPHKALLADFYAGVVANSGIDLRYRGTKLRVFKTGDSGQLPPPRDSVGLREFYDQKTLPLFPVDERDQAPPNSRLVYLWDVDENKNLSTLKLVCPKGVAQDWTPGLIHWEVEIPHPAAAIAAPFVDEEEALHLEEIHEKEEDDQG